MALSEDLPLYRDSLRLLNQLIPLTQGFPRFFRYSLGSRMVELNLDMLSLIYKPVPADRPSGFAIRWFEYEDF